MKTEKLESEEFINYCMKQSTCNGCKRYLNCFPEELNKKVRKDESNRNKSKQRISSTKRNEEY